MSTAPVERVHPSGATAARRTPPDDVDAYLGRLAGAPSNVVPFPAAAHRHRHADTDEIGRDDRPDGAASREVLAYLTGLLNDTRSTLVGAVRDDALVELQAVMHDATIDAIREDPTVTPVSIPGRAATAALRILIGRALVQAEWNA